MFEGRRILDIHTPVRKHREVLCVCFLNNFFSCWCSACSLLDYNWANYWGIYLVFKYSRMWLSSWLRTTWKVICSSLFFPFYFNLCSKERFCFFSVWRSSEDSPDHRAFCSPDPNWRTIQYRQERLTWKSLIQSRCSIDPVELAWPLCLLVPVAEGVVLSGGPAILKH